MRKNGLELTVLTADDKEMKGKHLHCRFCPSLIYRLLPFVRAAVITRAARDTLESETFLMCVR